MRCQKPLYRFLGLVTLLLVLTLFLTACQSATGTPLGIISLTGRWSGAGLKDALGLGRVEEMMNIVLPEPIVNLTEDGEMLIFIDDKPLADYLKPQMISSGMDESLVNESLSLLPTIRFAIKEDRLSITTRRGGEERVDEGPFMRDKDSLTLRLTERTLTLNKQPDLPKKAP